MTSKPESLYGKRIREREAVPPAPEPRADAETEAADHARAFRKAVNGTLYGQMRELNRAMNEVTTVTAKEAAKAMEAVANAFGKLKRKP